MVLLRHDASGKRGRCDARCYNGKRNGKCRCICGGRNHGVGAMQAIENSKAILCELAVRHPPVQEELFS